jgi:hypothetical protein
MENFKLPSKYASKKYTTLVNLNIGQWVVLVIYTVLTVVLIVGPGLFLVRGFALNILPSTSFITMNYLLVFSKFLFVMLTMIYLTYQINGLISKFVYAIYFLFVVSISFGIVILLIVYSINPNSQKNPQNPANSDFYCCKYGSSVPECQSPSYPPPVCNALPDQIENLKINPVFVQYFIIVGFLFLIEIIILVIQWFYIMQSGLVKLEALKISNKKSVPERQVISGRFNVPVNDYKVSSTKTPVVGRKEMVENVEFDNPLFNESDNIVSGLLKVICNKIVNFGADLPKRLVKSKIL